MQQSENQLTRLKRKCVPVTVVTLIMVIMAIVMSIIIFRMILLRC
ncbi:hypothetical protein [Eubacterium sp.]